MRKGNLGLFLASTASAATAPTATISTARIIGTTTAVVTGNGTSATVDQYLGIPYAEPPLGDLRFAPPIPPVSLGNGTYQATSWPNACIQQGSADLLTSESEDCMYLSVFAPSTAAPAPIGRAVMVWIHGGSLKTGPASIAEYDGSVLAARQDVVVVAINYRLRVLGFSNAPALTIKDRNAGFYDQRLALRWVQESTGAFGGDAAQVTVFGESSGSTSVSRLAGTLAADPPFRAAILENGWYDYASIMDVAGDVVGGQAWTAIVDQLNCTAATDDDELACMHAVDAAAIQTALAGFGSVTFTGAKDSRTQLAAPERAHPS
jgi:carboxylesterase type B